MFPSTCCVVSTMAWTIMMTMSAGAAILKADNHTGAAVKSALETVTLELDPGLLYPSQTVQQLQNRSISPWTYDRWQDAAIFPPVSEARCVLVGCLDHHGAEDAGLRSRPILHQVTLLRRVESPGGRRRYRLEPRLVAVGCTCVRDAVRRG
ncbi:interleukin 17a/f1 [Stigmatopora nigra]